MIRVRPLENFILKANFKKIAMLLWGIFNCFLNADAQLYINGDILIQAGENLYATDSITLGLNQNLVVNGTVQSTKGINTNGNYIKTLNGGSIISPVSSGVAKSFDIGTSSNNRIKIQQNSGSTVSYRLNVSDNIHTNPQTKTTPINSNVINKTWLVQPITGSNSTVITLFWNITDELSGFNRANCAISKWQQNTTTSWSFTTASASAQNTGISPSYSRTLSAGNLPNSIHYFGVGGSGSSLPIELLAFNARNQNDDVKLEWTTTTEFNNSHFEIQQSIDNINWKQIAIEKGSGNSNTPVNYEFTDLNPYKILQVEKIYYRLKQVDFDETFSISEVKIVNVNKHDNFAATEVLIYPNPSSSHIYIKILNPISTQYQVEVTDLYGKSIQSLQMNSNESAIDLTELSSGIYFIKVIDPTLKTTISTSKIFKD